MTVSLRGSSSKRRAASRPMPKARCSMAAISTKQLRDIRDAEGNIAADAAKRIGMAPYGEPDKST